MEHSRIKKRNVALIEKCVMSSIGIESLFRKFAGNPYKLHTYTSQESFQMPCRGSRLRRSFFLFLP
ncbi:BglJ family transcriptional regulator [Escherichia coli]|nr:BglJ family transcriptional regulator [Escherichia coli]